MKKMTRQPLILTASLAVVPALSAAARRKNRLRGPGRHATCRRDDARIHRTAPTTTNSAPAAVAFGSVEPGPMVDANNKISPGAPASRRRALPTPRSTPVAAARDAGGEVDLPGRPDRA